MNEKSTEKHQTAGKGRPTRKRKEAEIRPGASLAPALTKAEKKSQRTELRARRIAQREAYMRGDENALPLRDRGPVRRFARNCVDSRFSIGEFFIPFFFVVFLVLNLTIRLSPKIANLSILLIYAMMILAVIDGVLLGQRVKRRVAAKFPNESTKGIALYAFIRTTQMRRMRAPRPLVKRGDSF